MMWELDYKGSGNSEGKQSIIWVIVRWLLPQPGREVFLLLFSALYNYQDLLYKFFLIISKVNCSPCHIYALVSVTEINTQSRKARILIYVFSLYYHIDSFLILLRTCDILSICLSAVW